MLARRRREVLAEKRKAEQGRYDARKTRPSGEDEARIVLANTDVGAARAGRENVSENEKALYEKKLADNITTYGTIRENPFASNSNVIEV